MSKVTSVKVRMYRHGFGDCFLLRFYAGRTLTFKMLVDCGLKMNSKGSVPITDVIADLRKLLAPKKGAKPHLDVLVATHEHWDHVSAFHPKAKNFDDFDIDKIWLAWTEDPKDEDAHLINSRLRKGVTALAIAAKELQRTQPAHNALYSLHYNDKLKESREKFVKGMEDMTGFYGNTDGLGVAKTTPDGIKYNTTAKLSADTQKALEHLISLAGKSKNAIQYFQPGTLVDTKLLPDGINVFVLGPPKNKQINKSNPSKGKDKEVYFGLDSGGATGFVDGLLSMTDAPGLADSRPFDRETEAVATPKQHPYYKRYFDKQEDWRNIDHDWLDMAGQFALQLDGAINNTSLVLAIQLADSEKVLLFPGDAQVGSWESWHDHTWRIKKDGKQQEVNAEYLLNNTVLYKVSHHGSHNATVKDRGLELMTHDELVALIPEKEKSYNGILYAPLMKRLQTMCKGRVVVSDDVKYKAETLSKGKKPDALSAKEWKAFNDNLEIDKVYVEYTIRG